MKSIKFLPFLFAILFLVTCEHDPVEPEDPVNANPMDTTKNPADTNNNPVDTTQNKNCEDSAYFVNDILPIFNSTCALSGCHDVTSAVKGLRLNNYQNIITSKVRESGDSVLAIMPLKPDDSEIYKKIEENEMPPGAPLSQDQKDLIKNWILEGAKNNECIECDSIFTYSGFVEPLMQKNCTGCHGGMSPAGGIGLESHSDVSNYAQLIEGAIKHETGFSPMPQGSDQLSECEQYSFSQWINEGKKND